MTYDVGGRPDNQRRITGDFKLFDQRPTLQNFLHFSPIFSPDFSFFGEHRRAIEKISKQHHIDQHSAVSDHFKITLPYSWPFNQQP